MKRKSAVNRLGEMLQGLIAAAEKKRMKLAPFIGIGCPGVIEADGSIDREAAVPARTIGKGASSTYR